MTQYTRDMTTTPVSWEPNAQARFNQMIAKVPIFLRPMAEKTVGKKAEEIVLKAGRSQITEKDMVDAFFEGTPFGFHGPMKCDMEELGIDYVKHGHPK